MNTLKKIILKLNIESRFLLEQKWGLRKPSDPYSIPKYLLKKFLPKNPVIIDCGAHIGADSVELAKIFSKSTIHSFEPVPELFNSLKYNTRRFANINCYQLALSHRDGKAIMNISSGESDASSSLLVPTGHIIDHPQVHFDKTINVTTLTLDTWAKDNKVARVDFLWLDMQGSEYLFLEQSSVILNTVKVIHTEVSIRESYAGTLVYTKFKSWLASLGFEVVSEAIPHDSDMGNALFVRQ